MRPPIATQEENCLQKTTVLRPPHPQGFSGIIEQQTMDVFNRLFGVFISLSLIALHTHPPAKKSLLHQ
jgi:hypothetical protein